MTLRKLGFLVFLSAPLLGATTGDAFAYLDPGTGSMILQIIFGGVAGLMVVGKLYWAKFKALFSRGSGPSTDAEDATPDRH